MVSEKHRQYQRAGWLIFTPRHKPQDSLYGHLVFCLKYEGINLLFLKKLFEKIEEKVVETIIPQEVSYLLKFDEFKSWLDDKFEMPDKLVSQLVRFLEQNDAVLSERARTKEFALRTNDEVHVIEKHYQTVFQR